jgi:ABC-type nitrate/sulfonate/bicarbonate transport system substrate-binding protein
LGDDPDKVIYGELDAAHAPAGMVVAVTCGIGAVKTDCVAGVVINLHGNAITLSQTLWRRGVRDGHTLADYVSNAPDRLTLGIVYQHSSHGFMLRNWLRAHRIDPDRTCNSWSCLRRRCTRTEGRPHRRVLRG